MDSSHPGPAIISDLLKHRKCSGGERGIRTLGTLLEHTRFPSVRLKPLGHLSTKDMSVDSLVDKPVACVNPAGYPVTRSRTHFS